MGFIFIFIFLAEQSVLSAPWIFARLPEFWDSPTIVYSIVDIFFEVSR